MTGPVAARRRADSPLLWLAALVLAGLALLPLIAAWKLAPDLGQGWAAPLFIAYLFWERWPERPDGREPARLGWPWWLGAAAIAAAAFPLQLFLLPYPLWPALVWAYVSLLAGTALIGAGLLAGWPGVRWLAGPLVVLAGAMPWPGQIEQGLIYPLREAMASLAAEAIDLLGYPALAAGTSVQLGSGWVGVDEACGGIRSLEAGVMIALFFGEWLRFSWKRRFALVGLAVLAAVLGNFLRIFFLALRQTAASPAGPAFHDAVGWLALALTLALIGLTARRWARRGMGGSPPPPRPADSRLRAARPADGSGRLASCLCALSALLVGGELAAQEWFARGEAAAAGRPRWTAALPEEREGFRAEPLGESAREMLRPDFYRAGTWRERDGAAVSAYYIEWRRGQAARFIPFLHNPTICLPLAGCDLVASLGDFPVRWSGGEIPFHGYRFRRAGRDLTVAFAVWDTARNRPLAKPDGAAGWVPWLRMQWKDVREARRDQPAQLLAFAVGSRCGIGRLTSVAEGLIGAPGSGFGLRNPTDSQSLDSSPPDEKIALP